MNEDAPGIGARYGEFDYREFTTFVCPPCQDTNHHLCKGCDCQHRANGTDMSHMLDIKDAE